MADHSRLDDLRRRVQKDPASIAFAQLAEECRRAHLFDEAIAVCRAGLATHPAYLSARVTLGRALLELNQLDEAQAELEQVLRSAAENLAAIRGLAEIHHRRGNLPEALAQYQAALALARNDPDLEQTVHELSRQVAPVKRPEAAEGLSFEQMRNELAAFAPPTSPSGASAGRGPGTSVPPVSSVSSASSAVSAGPFASSASSAVNSPASVKPSAPSPTPAAITLPASSASAARAQRTIVALERFLARIHVARADLHA